ncbi:MAG: hypothetical protein ACXWKG_09555 [Limisphaerales bacterium]
MLGKTNFARPLLPYEAYDPAKLERPRKAWGGYQHVVTDEQEANSSIGFLMVDSSPTYSLEQLSHNRRRLINSAAEQIEIRPIRDLCELQEQGFAAYSSFYHRTGYQYLSARRKKDIFCQWAANLLCKPGALILGSYDSSGLVGVSVSYWVKDTLLYATHFSHSNALRQGAGELMIHSLRQIAAQTPGIRQIFVRRFQGGNGMDQYYLMRGAKLVHMPAKLCLNPVLNLILKHWQPQRHAILHGTRVEA